MSRAAMGLTLAGALVLAGATQRDTPSKTTKPRAAVALRVPADPNVAITSTYICLRVQPGVQAMQLADGSWTLRRAANANAGGVDDALLAQDERALNAVFTRHHVTRITRFMNGEFKRPDLAAKYGLDRSHIVRVDQGADVRALVVDLAANFPALIDFAELDNIGSLAGIPNDPSFSLQWNMHNTGQTGGSFDADIDAPEGWDIHTGSSATIIAIIDSGVQSNHPDLLGKVLVGADVYGVNPPPYPTDTADINSIGHGTHVSGIAAARGNDSIGVSGVNWNAKILPIRVVDPGGASLNQTDLSEGAIWATDNGADVINMSVQFNSTLQIMQDACAYAYDSGALPVAAAGNSSATSVSYPAKYPKCVGVSGTQSTDAWWSGSNRGPEIDVSAPGAGVYSLNRTSGYQSLTGTSMATPHVAGLAGLISSRNPALNSAQIEAIIKNTADDKGAVGWDENFGWGRININAAMIAAAPPCDGNTNGDGVINVTDLLAVIGAWGACVSPPTGCAGDVAPIGPPIGDGQVNVTDLLLVISRWGPCP